ncbi:unnamed protein product [Aspergillus oryzae]|nr:unnamed protein product [Aspergillus oryzae]
MVEPNHSEAHCQSSSQNNFPLGGTNCFTVKIIPHLHDSLDANGDADLNQPFNISWLEYFYDDDKLMASLNQKHPSSIPYSTSLIFLRSSVVTQELDATLQYSDGPMTNAESALCKCSINTLIGRLILSRVFRISGATPLDSTAV